MNTLPTLTGTPKQIAQATELRNFLATVSEAGKIVASVTDARVYVKHAGLIGAGMPGALQDNLALETAIYWMSKSIK